MCIFAFLFLSLLCDYNYVLVLDDSCGVNDLLSRYRDGFDPWLSSTALGCKKTFNLGCMINSL